MRPLCEALDGLRDHLCCVEMVSCWFNSNELESDLNDYMDLNTDMDLNADMDRLRENLRNEVDALNVE